MHIIKRAGMPNLLKSAPKVFTSGSVYNKLLVKKVSASNYDRLQPEKKSDCSPREPTRVDGNSASTNLQLMA
jgi:hypothetical protein